MKNQKQIGTYPLAASKLMLFIVAFFLLPIANCQFSFAQIRINLQSAMDTALKNNLLVKNEILLSEYQKKLKVAAVDMPLTNLVGEYGQINSFYQDTKLGIAQSLSFPAVYAKQKSLQNEYYKSSVLSIAVKEAELKKQVSEVFYLLIYLEEKKKLLLQNDSVYASFLEKVNLRFIKGESNVLEKTTAETQRGQIAIQCSRLKNDVDVLQLQFQLLLNTPTAYIPFAESPRIISAALFDTVTLSAHPQVKILQEQKIISAMNTRLAKAKLLPDFAIGYYNQSIQGIGADDRVYTKSTRFNSVQLGVGVPLFFFSQRAKIKSSKLLQHVAENNYQLGLHTMKTAYETAFKKYQTQLQTVNYFETTALKNANTILQTANRQFANGDINYLEWTLLIHNAASIKSHYADAVHELNQTIIQLRYVTSN
jgi:heavy metal efflux system protein